MLLKSPRFEDKSTFQTIQTLLIAKRVSDKQAILLTVENVFG
jgi:hypothetical protein